MWVMLSIHPSFTKWLWFKSACILLWRKSINWMQMWCKMEINTRHHWKKYYSNSYMPKNLQKSFHISSCLCECNLIFMLFALFYHYTIFLLILFITICTISPYIFLMPQMICWHFQIMWGILIRCVKVLLSQFKDRSGKGKGLLWGLFYALHVLYNSYVHLLMQSQLIVLIK